MQTQEKAIKAFGISNLKKVKIAVVPGLFWHLHFLQDYSHPCQHQLSPFSLWVPSLPSKKGREKKKKKLFLILHHQDRALHRTHLSNLRQTPSPVTEKTKLWSSRYKIFQVQIIEKTA